MARYLKFVLVGLITRSIAEDCEEYGFDGDLQCGICHDMKNFDIDDEIQGVCRSCCKEEEQETIQKYTSATLIICQ